MVGCSAGLDPVGEVRQKGDESPTKQNLLSLNLETWIDAAVWASRITFLSVVLALGNFFWNG